MKIKILFYKIRRTFIFLFSLLYLLSANLLFAVENTEAIKRAKEICIFITAEFKINNKNPPISKYGTGFVIDTIKSPGLVVVTNKHILEHNINGTILAPSRIIIKINMSENEKTYYNAQIIGLHDYYDIGLLYPKGLVNIPKDTELKKSSNKEYYEWKTKNIILEETFIDDSKIEEGREVFFIGFPLNLGTDKFENFPIARKGLIAQVIPGEKEFIMDGFASHGNSGSPVFCLVNNSIKLIGIQKGVYNDFNIGYDENGNLNSLSQFNSGLSLVIKASVIKDFLYDLIDKGKYKGDWSD